MGLLCFIHLLNVHQISFKLDRFKHSLQSKIYLVEFLDPKSTDFRFNPETTLEVNKVFLVNWLMDFSKPGIFEYLLMVHFDCLNAEVLLVKPSDTRRKYLKLTVSSHFSSLLLFSLVLWVKLIWRKYQL